MIYPTSLALWLLPFASPCTILWRRGGRLSEETDVRSPAIRRCAAPMSCARQKVLQRYTIYTERGLSPKKISMTLRVNNK